MRKLKKSFAFLLALCMLLSMAVPAFATEIRTQDTSLTPPVLTVDNVNTEDNYYEDETYLWNPGMDYGTAITEVKMNGQIITRLDYSYEFYYNQGWCYDSDLDELYISIPARTNFTIVISATGYSDLEIIGGDGFEANTAPQALTEIHNKLVRADSTSILGADEIASDADGDAMSITEATSIDSNIVTVEVQDGVATLTGIAIGSTTIDVVVSDGRASSEPISVPVSVVGRSAAPSLQSGSGSFTFNEGPVAEGTNVVLIAENTENGKAWITALYDLDSEDKKAAFYVKSAGDEDFASNSFPTAPSITKSSRKITLTNSSSNSFFATNTGKSNGQFTVKICVPGYEDALVDVTIVAKAPSFTKDTTNNTMVNNTLENNIVLTFTEDAVYRNAISAIGIKGFQPGAKEQKYEKSSGIFDVGTPGQLTIDKSLFPVGGGNYSIVVYADGYTDSLSVSQTIIGNPPALQADAQNYLLNAEGKLESNLVITFEDDANWREKISTVTIDDTTISSSYYTKAAGTITFDVQNESVAKALTEGTHEITFETASYSKTYTSAALTQVIAASAEPPSVSPDNSENYPNNAIELTFEDNEAWRSAITDIKVDGASATGNYTVEAGKITLNATLFPEEKDYTIEIIANTYPGEEGNNFYKAVVRQDIVSSNPFEAPSLSAGEETHYALNDVILTIDTQDNDYGTKIYQVYLNNVALKPQQDYTYDAETKQMTIHGALLTQGIDYTIQIKATGYKSAQVIIPVSLNPSPKFDSYTFEKGTSSMSFYFANFDNWYNAIQSGYYYQYQFIAIDGKTLTSSSGLGRGEVTSSPDPEMIGKHYLSFGYSLTKDFYNDIGLHTVTISFPGFETTTIPIIIVNASPEVKADSTNATINNDMELTFTDDAAWRGAISEIMIDGVSIDTAKYTVEAGKITLDKSLFAVAKDYAIVIKATNYLDVEITQTVGERNLKISNVTDTTVQISGNHLNSNESYLLVVAVYDSQGCMLGMNSMKIENLASFERNITVDGIESMQYAKAFLIKNDATLVPDYQNAEWIVKS